MHQSRHQFFFDLYSTAYMPFAHVSPKPPREPVDHRTSLGIGRFAAGAVAGLLLGLLLGSLPPGFTP